MTVIDFPNASHRSGAPRRRAAYGSRTGACPNLQRPLFRSSSLIVESDEADLVRDVCFAVDRAQTKLKRIQQRLKDVQEQAAANVQLLTTAETKLTAAIVAALLSAGSYPGRLASCRAAQRRIERSPVSEISEFCFLNLGGFGSAFTLRT
jgi:hypothetical protein